VSDPPNNDIAPVIGAARRSDGITALPSFVGLESGPERDPALTLRALKRRAVSDPSNNDIAPVNQCGETIGWGYSAPVVRWSGVWP